MELHLNLCLCPSLLIFISNQILHFCRLFLLSGLYYNYNCGKRVVLNNNGILLLLFKLYIILKPKHLVCQIKPSISLRYSSLHSRFKQRKYPLFFQVDFSSISFRSPSELYSLPSCPPLFLAK